MEIKKESTYELTNIQMGMCIQHKLSNNISENVIQKIYTLEGNLEPILLQQATLLLVEKNAALGVRIKEDSELGFLQYFLSECDFLYDDLSMEEHWNDLVKLRADYERKIGFELIENPLIRFRLLRCKENYYKFIWTYHHIVMDESCIELLWEDLFKIYQELVKSKEYMVKNGEAKIGNYYQWYKKQQFEKQLKYWNELLKNYENVAGIISYEDNIHRKVGYGQIKKTINCGIFENLKVHCHCNDINISTVLELAWGIILQRYNRLNDVVFGRISFGRSEKELHDLVGLFVCTTPLRVFYEADTKIMDALNSLQLQKRESEKKQLCPLNDIQSQTKVAKDLIQSILLFTDESKLESCFKENSKLFNVSLEQSSIHATYPINIHASVREGQLEIRFIYDEKIYIESEIERLSDRMNKVIEDIVNNFTGKIESVSILLPKEEVYINEQFNKTFIEYPTNETIVDLLEEQANTCGNKIALAYKNHTLTYKEFNEKVNCVAHELRKRGIGRGDIVPIIAKRSFEMIVGIYGIIKAGASYVPLDIDYPEERIQYIIKDCSAKLLVIYGAALSVELEKVDLSDKEIWNNSNKNLTLVNQPSDLAYIIYTSGTTGQPKGVMVKHSGVVAMRYYLKNLYQVNERDSILQFANYVFDASVWEMTISLLNGAKLVLINKQDIMDIDRFNYYTKEQDISICLLPPQFYMQTKIQGLKVLTTGGSSASCELISRAIKENERYINAYGPTENTVLATHWEVTEKTNIPKYIPIGIPMDNSKIYIMNGDSLCGVGIPGEILISGAGVAKGYLNQEQLTQEKFTINPYDKTLMYHSGDLGVWLENGIIVYLGRIDEQVKIRGYRIELLEIENVIRKIFDVRDIAVVAQKENNNDKIICAYIVADKELDLQRISDELHKHIPEYMIPSRMMQIDKIPINQSGKVDQQALPRIEVTKEASYITPSTIKEKVLCQVFEDVLGIEKVGIRDSFFGLGGDSIKAIRIVSKIRGYGYDISVRTIMDKSIVENIASELEKVQQKEYSQSEVFGSVKETPIIRTFRKWNLKRPNHFNQDLMMDIGKQTKNDVETILTAIVVHHDMLRAIYENGELRVLEAASSELFRMEEIDCGELDVHKSPEIQKRYTSIQESIDLEHGPLIVGAIVYTKEKNYLFLCIHHIVIDGVSWRILIDDYEVASNQLAQGEEIHLPAKTASFKEWAIALNEYKNSSLLKEEEVYWNNIDNQVKQIYGLNKRKKLLEKDSFQTVQIRIDKKRTTQLVHKASYAYSTEINDLLLSALVSAMRKIDGCQRVSVTLEGHGREEIHKRILVDRTVGWFTTMYPVVLECFSDMEKVIIETKEMLHKIPKHGIGYGVLEKKDTKYCQLSFNYLGQLEYENSGKDISLLKHGLRNAKENGYFSSLSFTGLISEGELVFTIQYNEKYYCNQWANDFSLEYQKEIEQIIDFCVSKKEKILTPSDYGVYDLTYHDFRDIVKQHGEIEAIYPLSPLQQGILFQNIISENPTEYFIQNIFDISGEVKDNQIERALELLAIKYPVLKTAFIFKGVQNPKQVIVKQRNIEYTAINELEYTENRIKEIARKDLERGFNLVNDSLIRVKAIFTNNKCVKMIWSYHHIIMDGWCLSLIFGDFIKFIDLLEQENCEGIHEEILKYRSNYSSYKDYIHLQQKKDKMDAIQYWEKLLCGYENYVEVDSFQDKVESKYEVDSQRILFSKELTQKLINLSRNQYSTLNSVIETAWGVLLQAYTYSNDIVFGKVVSGRNAKLKGIEQIVGLLANTIPVRVERKQDTSFVELLKDIQQQGLDSEQYDYVTLAEIQAATTGKEALIQNLVVFENYMEEEATHLNGKQLKMKLMHAREQTNYNINLIAGVKFEQLYIEIMYNSRKYCSKEIVLLIKHLECIFEHIIENPYKPIRHYELITKEEKDYIIHQINQTEVIYDQSKTIIDLLEEQVVKHKDKVALIFQGQSMTYEALNQRVNAIAHELRYRGISPGDKVPIIAQRGFEMILGIYGIIKAGAAYVPIDPEYPEERIQYIIQDCNAKLVIVYNASILLYKDCPNIQQLDLMSDCVINQSVCNPEKFITPEDLAYVIYTSGTSGKPKGVLLKHRGIVAMNQYLKELYQVVPEDRVLQFANYVFDASVWEMTMAILNGATLVLISHEDILDIQRFNYYTQQKKISLTLLPPQYYLQSDIRDLKVLTTGGSAASLEVVKRAVAENSRYINAYGPTENTVLATHWEYCDKYEFTSRIPIGRPISNSKIYIINEGGLCGIGVPGELCITGPGVASGYLNQDNLTKEKFISNPFGEGVLYCTGDLAKWNLNGEILYLGRIDKQVKIHGYRVELMEIESLLRTMDLIDDVAVIVRKSEQGDPVICAYLVSKEKLDIDSIKEMLRSQLPYYMVPSKMLQIDKIPVNQSGKVNEKQLPDIYVESFERYEEPRTEDQKVLCNIFAKVLSVETVGIHDSFFSLGGHSIYAIQLVNWIGKKLGRKVSVKDIFLNDTVERLDNFLKQDNSIGNSMILPVEEREYYPMSPMEQQIYVASCLDESYILYNMPQVFRIKGMLEQQHLIKALEQISTNHEILRTGFEVRDGYYVQRIYNYVEVDYKYINVPGKMTKEDFNCFVQAFVLEQPPLFRVRLIEDEVAQYLMIDIHHIICDGVSMDIFLDELKKYYIGESVEVATIQYKDFSDWYLKQDSTISKDFWNSKLSEVEMPSRIPSDYKREQNNKYVCNCIQMECESAIVHEIKKVAADTESTEYMVFLSALMLLLSEYTIDNNVVVGTPVNGRIHNDIEHMLGVFINVLPLAISIQQDETYVQFLNRVKETCLGAFSHQNYSYEWMADIEANQGKEIGQGLFHVLFSYQQDVEDIIYFGENECVNINLKESVSKYELQFIVSRRQAKWYLELLYCSELYKQSSMYRMLQRFQDILRKVTFQVSAKLSEFEFVTVDERQQILNTFNDTKKDFQKKNVVDMYHEHVQLHKNQIALISNEKQLTYGEFDCRVQYLVGILRSNKVKNNDFVVIIANRNVEMIAGIYAILASGAAYVPIDPSYPKERIEYILNDCKPKLILLTEGVDIVTDYKTYVMDESQVIEESECIYTGENIHEDDLAYCIYTSGTTGKPKGVMIQHKSLYNSICCFYDEFIDTDKITSPLFTNYAFDLTVPTIYLPLCYGGTLELIDEDKELDFDYILSRRSYTFFKMTPSHLKLLLNSNASTLTKGCTVVVGGEFLRCETANEFLERYGENARLINEYGPTEATVGATIYPYREFENGIHVSIGKPLANTKIYIMSQNRLCGIGVIGEICIAGDGVAKGYLNCEQLQNEKFIDNPFGEGKIYRTGDLGRWLEDGNIECLGRTDDQVKVNGHRIEIGDIESTIAEIDGIQDVVVVSKVNRIFAYYVATSKISWEKIRIHLENKLPGYMIPVGYMQLDEIPLTYNGKINKKMLPDVNTELHNEYVAPESDIERLLLECFQDVLGIQHVGMMDSFYALGGDSIKAIQISSKMQEKGYSLSVKDIMSQHRVKKICNYISESNYHWKNNDRNSGRVTPTPMIEEFFTRNLSRPEHYTQDVLLYVNNHSSEDVVAALNTIVEYHDILRSNCKDRTIEVHFDAAHKFYEVNQYKWPNISIEDKRVDDKCLEMQKGFSLESGPLVKVAFFSCKEGNYVFICIHHLAVDGVSFRIIIDDFYKILECTNDVEKNILPPKTASFIEWSEALAEYKQCEQLLQEREYWNKELGNLKNGRLPVNITNKIEIERYKFILNQYETEKLLYETNRTYGTRVVDIIVSSLAKACNDIWNQKIIAILMEGHGREVIHKDIPVGRTVGWFTNRYPVVINCFDDLKDCLIYTKDKLRRIPNNGFGYSLLYPFQNERIPTISFNYLGQMDNGTSHIRGFCSRGESVSRENGMICPIDINVYVVQNQFVYDIYYNSAVVPKGIISQLCINIQNYLQELIRLCTKQSKIIKTASDFTDRMLTSQELDKILNLLPLDQIQDIYPLTSLQEGILFYSMAHLGSSEYIVQHVFSIRDLLNSRFIQEAVQLVINRHDALRTRFIYENMNKPRQIVLNEQQAEISFVEINSLHEVEQFCEQVMKEERNKFLDLFTNPLLRVICIHCGEQQYKMIWTYHHIIMDGWCSSILFTDFLRYKKLLEQGLSYSELNEMVQKERSQATEYGEYVNYIQSKPMARAKDYWKKLMEGYDEVAEFKNSQRKTQSINSSNRDRRLISKELSNDLFILSKENSITINTCTEVMCALVLAEYGKIQDVVFGKVVSGRNEHLQGINNIIGLFINTIPVRVHVEKETMLELLKKVHKQGIESNQYSYYSLAEIQSETNQKGDLIKVLYAFENYYERFTEDLADFHFETGREQTNYSISISVSIVDSQIAIDILYDESEYQKEEIEFIFDKMECVLEQMNVNLNVPIEGINFITKQEQDLILHQFNNTITNYPIKRTIVEIFEDEVKRYGNEIAVIYQNQQISYRELNEKVNCVANELRERGIQQGDIVPIIAKRSIEMLVGIYGIIKAGAAYVPIDIEYPEERILYIIDDCSAKAVVVYGTDFNTRYPILDLSDEKVWENNPNNPIRVNNPEDLAYVIYTSGTTGKPKGVMLRHSGVVNMRYYLKELYQVDNHDRILQFANYVFDASVWEMTMALLNGAKLVLIDKEDIINVNRFNQYTMEQGVTITLLPPQYYMQTNIHGLKVLTTGGSAASKELVLRAVKENERYINAYGPTENTVLATHWSANLDSYIPDMIPIGVPMSNCQIYIMNKNKLCGINIPGELCITGEGVAVGYLNQNSLTDTKFVQNPFGKGVMYRTGDLAKWTTSGDIEYLGRIDKQVKVRGFRIELLEIESVLRQLDKVEDAAVIVREYEGKDNNICAYVVSKYKLNLEDINIQLRKFIPEYMIPTRMLQIEQIPMSRSGKVNEKALPEIQLENDDTYIPPSNELEYQVCKVFEEVLSIERVGKRDSFFALGGDSIKAIRIVSKIRELGYNISVREIMDKYIVDQIASTLMEVDIQNAYSQDEVVGMIENTPIITMFHSWKLPNESYFNQDIMIELSDETEEEIATTLQTLVIHHDMLRAIYRDKKLYVLDSEKSELFTLYDYKCIGNDEDAQKEIYEECTKIQASINLQSGPLIKAAIIRTTTKKYLFICVHHLIIDGVSWRILLEDYHTVLKQLREGQSIELPKKTASFQEWASALQVYKDDDRVQKVKAYWENVQDQLENFYNQRTRVVEEQEEIGLKYYKKEGSHVKIEHNTMDVQKEYGQIVCILDKLTTQQLLYKTSSAYGTDVQEILLCALALSYYELTNEHLFVVGLEGHGREEINKKIDIDRTVGWFTTMYPVVLLREDSLEDNIIETKETLRKIPNHGLEYGLLYQEEDRLPEICFNYLGRMDEQNQSKRIRFFQSGQSADSNNKTNAILSISVMEVDEMFKISFAYVKEKWSDIFMELFLQEYVAKLEQCITNCMEQEESVKTISDLDTDDLTMEELEFITSMLQ